MVRVTVMLRLGYVTLALCYVVLGLRCVRVRVTSMLCYGWVIVTHLDTRDHRAWLGLGYVMLC